MNLSDSKKKLALAGLLCGLIAAALAYFGNPANMAFCIACFIRDTAGALGMHSAEAVQYARPEIIGLVLGAFLISVITKEYRSSAGSSPVIRFVLGMILVIGSLVFLGCPLRMIIRMSAGDLNAWVALIGFVLGVGTGVIALKRGVSRTGTRCKPHKRRRYFCTFAWCFSIVIDNDTVKEQCQRSGSMHSPIIISLVGGLIFGVLAQKSNVFCGQCP